MPGSLNDVRLVVWVSRTLLLLLRAARAGSGHRRIDHATLVTAQPGPVHWSCLEVPSCWDEPRGGPGGRPAQISDSMLRQRTTVHTKR